MSCPCEAVYYGGLQTLREPSKHTRSGTSPCPALRPQSVTRYEPPYIRTGRVISDDPLKLGAIAKMRYLRCPRAENEAGGDAQLTVHHLPFSNATPRGGLSIQCLIPPD